MSVGYVVFSIYMASTICLIAGGLMQVHLLWYSGRGRHSSSATLPAVLPLVTIQIPVYNEKYVVEELLYSVAALQYPKHLLELQVLDDSTDITSHIIDRVTMELKANDVLITVIRRGNRNGYKAGALQHGLSVCKGEFIVIMDADFRPPADFIQKLLPHFSKPGVGVVQARWGHLNKERNFLTRIQTYLLDMHFTVEQQGRFNAGYFTNFCGTAGVWRRQCITDAGGWDGGILSEDLELSYRAQLRGWTIVYDNDLVVPAQLPAVMEAFKIQQFRWTKGMAQTARKTLGPLWKAPLPIAKKWHGSFQLMSSLTFGCLFINAFLSVPLLLLRIQFPTFKSLSNYTATGIINLLMLTCIYYKAAVANGAQRKNFALNYPIFIVVYLALSVQNAIAVTQGLLGLPSAFVRTPKSGELNQHNNTYLNNGISWITIAEALSFTYFIAGIGLSFHYHDYFLLLFFCMMAAGLAILLYPFLPAVRLNKNLRYRSFTSKRSFN